MRPSAAPHPPFRPSPFSGFSKPRWYHGRMTFFRSLLFVCPAACLLAQTPPPAASPARPATPAPQPTVTLSRESPADVKMPVVPPDRVVLKVGDTSLTA